MRTPRPACTTTCSGTTTPNRAGTPHPTRSACSAGPTRTTTSRTPPRGPTRPRSPRGARPGGPHPTSSAPTPRQWTDALALTPRNGDTCPWAPTYREHQKELAGSGQNGHHIIQDAAVRDLPGYKKGDAPSISLEG